MRAYFHETTNHAKNPSFEVNITDDVTAVGVLVRDTAQYYVGVASCKIPATAASCYAQTTAGVLVANGAYATASARIRCSASPVGNKARIQATDLISQATPTYASVASNGAWEYLTATVQNTSGDARTFYLLAENNFNDATNFVWADACQLETSAVATTYCDGTQFGGSWAGTAHNSVSSRQALGGLHVSKRRFSLTADSRKLGSLSVAVRRFDLTTDARD